VTESTSALAKVEQPGELAQSSELSVEDIVSRVKKVHAVQREVMKEGVHFGKIPGVTKDCLLKPGAEILGMVFRLDPQFEVTERIRDGAHLTLEVKCTLFHIPTGARLGSGMGSCSTHESRYAYRKGERACPSCGKATIIKGKEEYGGGWICFAKKGGCGAKFGDKDTAITSQQTGRVENEDLADQHNTVLKMAIKRAHVAAILFVTCASEIFTQDVEDMPRRGAEEAPDEPAPAKQRQQQKVPASAQPAVQSVPSEADFERALEEIRRMPTTDGLLDHAKANRGRRWSKEQGAGLKAASDQRRAQLEDPDYRDEDPQDEFFNSEEAARLANEKVAE
jgi:nitrite reductase/ring-hydroxylating ferredoxin subunit